MGDESVLGEVHQPLLPEREREEAGCEVREMTRRRAVLNLLATTVGAGIVALPAGMQAMGLLLGSVSILFMAYLTHSSITLLLGFSKNEDWDYVSLLDGNSRARVYVRMFGVINTICRLIVYMKTFGDLFCRTPTNKNFQFGIERIFGRQGWIACEGYMLLAIAVFSYFTLIMNRDWLRRVFEIAAAALVIPLLLIILLITSMKIMEGSLPPPRWLPVVSDIYSARRLLKVVPALMTAYICHFNVLNIRSKLDKPTSMGVVVKNSLSGCAAAYLFSSILGFILFGDSTHVNVMTDFGDMSVSYWLNDLVRVIYGLHIMLILPNILYALIIYVRAMLPNIRFSVTAIVLVAIIFFGALSVPSIWRLFQIIRVIAAVFIGYLFPAVIGLIRRGDHGTTLDWIMISLAVIAIIVAIMQYLLK